MRKKLKHASPYGFEPVKVDLPNCSHLYEASNKIHRWYTVEQSIAALEARVKHLEADLEATKKTIVERKKLIHSLRVDAISCTDPVQIYVDNMDENKDES